MTTETMPKPISQELKIPPGPEGGNLLSSISEIRNKGLINFYTELWKQYGDIVGFKTGPLQSYLLTHPDYVQHVLVKNRDNYPKGMSHDKLRISLGYGLLTSENPLWRTQRKLMQPTYTPNGIRQFADVMVNAAKDMLARWSNLPEDAVISVNDEMMRVAMQVISRSMFGIDISENFVEAGDALTYILDYTSSSSVSILDLPLFVPTAKNRKLKHSLKTIDDFIYGIIDSRSKDTQGDDLLYMLMTARDPDTGEGMSRKQLRDEVLVTFFAGHETTASLLSWTFYLLSLHPEVETRFHEEIDAQLHGRSPTLDDIEVLNYTRMILDETLRLYSPVALTARDTVADDEISGYQIEGKSMVIVFPYGTHRHPEYWDHPMAFFPEHFNPEKVKERPRYAYYPFGAGPRICIGSHFALMEATLILAEIGQRYRLRLVPQPTVDIKFIGVMRPVQEIMMRLESR